MKPNTTIFDYLKDILIHKTGQLPLDNYVPFMINRWLSFLNPQIAEAINQANTKSVLEDKSLHYKLLLLLFPKIKYFPKIQYIKKPQETQAEEDIKIKILCENLEISKKEACLLLRESSS